jgi:hypothetical protein
MVVMMAARMPNTMVKRLPESVLFALVLDVCEVRLVSVVGDSASGSQYVAET